MAILRIHDVTLVSAARVLDDFAKDLARTLPHPIGAAIEVHIGLHRPDRRAKLPPRPTPDLLLGMQTEHILDAEGTPLWQRRHAEPIRTQIAGYDAVLDLSPANQAIYDPLPDAVRARIHFGPHIFPADPPPMALVPGGLLLFFGSMNQRRRMRIAKLEGQGVTVTRVPHATFGPALQTELAKASRLLNVHYAAGRYSEAPRVLKAVLAGKPLISEAMAPPFIGRQHYLPLSEASAGDDRLLTSYETLISMLKADYTFPGFLRKLAAEKGLLAQ